MTCAEQHLLLRTTGKMVKYDQRNPLGDTRELLRNRAMGAKILREEKCKEGGVTFSSAYSLKVFPDS